MARWLLFVSATLAAFTSPALAQNSLIPWGASGYRYQIYGPPGLIPVAVFYSDFDDSAWPIGSAPFGAADVCDTPASTYWPPDTRLVVRKHVALAANPTASALFLVYAGNQESHINFCNTGSTPWGPRCNRNITYFAPCLHAGDNVIAVVVDPLRDLNGYVMNGFDLRLDAGGVVAAQKETWGRLKLLYK